MDKRHLKILKKGKRKIISYSHPLYDYNTAAYLTRTNYLEWVYSKEPTIEFEPESIGVTTSKFGLDFLANFKRENRRHRIPIIISIIALIISAGALALSIVKSIP